MTEDTGVTRAREYFLQGTAFTEKAHWAQALQAFEESARLRPHAVTTYNIAACERAMGRYTRARKALLLALDAARWDLAARLPKSFEGQARALLNEFHRLLVHADLVVTPKGATLVVDGRPLEPLEGEGRRFYAGTLPPGLGAPVPSNRFEVLLDPGFHVFILGRKGFRDVLIRQYFDPGTRVRLPLALERLPGTLHVAANGMDAIVSVNGVDVGTAPVEVSRAPGVYRVVVQKDGMTRYETSLVLKPGEHVELSAKLSARPLELTDRWWFWTAGGTLLAGSILGVYWATRPEPRRPPLDGGSLGWTIDAR